MTKLRDFRSPPWETSLYKKIPIVKYNRESIKLIREIVGGPVRVLFRGPRPANSGRSSVNRQSNCLKQDAVTFTIYRNFRQ
jgi:hypothetical protein